MILEREQGQIKPFKCDILWVSDIIPAANRFGELWTLFTDVNVTDMAARLRAHPPLSGSKKMIQQRPQQRRKHMRYHAFSSEMCQTSMKTMSSQNYPTMEYIWKFHTHPRLKQTKEYKRQNQGPVSEIDASVKTDYILHILWFFINESTSIELNFLPFKLNSYWIYRQCNQLLELWTNLYFNIENYNIVYFCVHHWGLTVF